jgi:hypothetical protein
MSYIVILVSFQTIYSINYVKCYTTVCNDKIYLIVFILHIDFLYIKYDILRLANLSRTYFEQT